MPRVQSQRNTTQCVTEFFPLLHLGVPVPLGAQYTAGNPRLTKVSEELSLGLDQREETASAQAAKRFRILAGARNAHAQVTLYLLCVTKGIWFLSNRPLAQWLPCGLNM